MKQILELSDLKIGDLLKYHNTDMLGCRVVCVGKTMAIVHNSDDSSFEFIIKPKDLFDYVLEKK